MAYRKTYPRRFGRRRNYRKPRYTTMGSVSHLAKKAWGVAKYVKSIVNTEYKYIDNIISFTSGNTGYQLQPLTLMAQGDDMTQRNGRSVLGKALQVQLQLNLIAPIVYGTIRIVIICDTTASGALPNMSDIFDTVTSNQAVTSFRNIASAPSKRYQIWSDKRISLDVDTKDQIYYSWYKKLQTHVKYIGTSNAATSLGPGNFYIAIISTDANSFSVAGRSRFRFIDN